MYYVIYFDRLHVFLYSGTLTLRVDYFVIMSLLINMTPSFLALNFLGRECSYLLGPSFKLSFPFVNSVSPFCCYVTQTSAHKLIFSLDAWLKLAPKLAKVDVAHQNWRGIGKDN